VPIQYKLTFLSGVQRISQQSITHIITLIIFLTVFLNKRASCKSPKNVTLNEVKGLITPLKHGILRFAQNDRIGFNYTFARASKGR